MKYEVAKYVENVKENYDNNCHNEETLNAEEFFNSFRNERIKSRQGESVLDYLSNKGCYEDNL